MIVWVISLVVICTFLIVVEYLHSRVGQKTTLADMSREELYGLLDAELKEEFMAFAPLEKIRLDREAEQDGTPGLADPLSDAPPWPEGPRPARAQAPKTARARRAVRTDEEDLGAHPL